MLGGLEAQRPWDIFEVLWGLCWGTLGVFLALLAALLVPSWGVLGSFWGFLTVIMKTYAG